MNLNEDLAILAETADIPSDVRCFANSRGVKILLSRDEAPDDIKLLKVSEDGIRLEINGQSMLCDLTGMLPRLKRDNLSRELLVRAAKIKGAGRRPTVVDATAGLGEDSLMLAAAGFEVTLCERNPIIALLLKDALRRASAHGLLSEAVSRMKVIEGGSISFLGGMDMRPDVVYLDPMFPEKEKSALTKKKFQLLHCLELPCTDEHSLLAAAKKASPHKIVIKRPPKGPYLCGEKPSFSLQGKAVRYDCIVIA